MKSSVSELDLKCLYQFYFRGKEGSSFRAMLKKHLGGKTIFFHTSVLGSQDLMIKNLWAPCNYFSYTKLSGHKKMLHITVNCEVAYLDLAVLLAGKRQVR